MQLGMAVATNHYVNTRHRFGQAHVVTVSVASVLPFLHATMAESDDHIHLLRLAQDLHHLFGGFDGVVEGGGSGTAGIELGLLAKHPEESKADTAALDYKVSADHSFLAQALQVGQRRVLRLNIDV